MSIRCGIKEIKEIVNSWKWVGLPLPWRNVVSVYMNFQASYLRYVIQNVVEIPLHFNRASNKKPVLYIKEKDCFNFLVQC